MDKGVLLTTNFPELKLYKCGKVRDVYDLGDELLIVSTDRISCFDVILPCGIPHKGEVLTSLSSFWFDFTKDIAANHLISADVENFPVPLKRYKDALRGRSMLVRKTESIPIECVVRGYLSGSGWKEYGLSMSICGVNLPAGLLESAKLPAPIFTPSTKEDTGHDQNITFQYVEERVGRDIAQKLKSLSISLYEMARDYAGSKGIIIADTKFEFGMRDGGIILIDEALTPDSSRFWPKEGYAVGRSQPSFDKQFVRDYLEGLDWDKSPPAPNLPGEIIQKTSEKYLEALRKIIGHND